jgi:hypothetical protein
MPVAGEKNGDVRAQSALAASALRIQYHYVTHNPPASMLVRLNERAAVRNPQA